MIVSALEGLMQTVKNKKQNSDDGESARHWAVVYTDLEHIVAYLKTYLSEKESE